MVNRKGLIKSLFSKKNIVKAIDVILPVVIPEAEAEPVYDIPELSGEMLYYEAMRLGLIHQDCRLINLNRR